MGYHGELAPRLRPDQTLFYRIGECRIITRIIDGLYDCIEADNELKPMFSGNLSGERMKQKAFFEEHMGGKPRYTQRHAYGGLKSRHRHIHITRKVSERWFAHMTVSIHAVVENDAFIEEVLQILKPLAYGLINEEKPAAGDAQHLRCHRTKRWREPTKLVAKGQLNELRQFIETDLSLLS